MSEIFEWLGWGLAIIFIIPITVIFVLPPWISGPMIWVGVYVWLVGWVDDKFDINSFPTKILSGFIATIVMALILSIVVLWGYMRISWDELMLVFQSEAPLQYFKQLLSSKN